MPPLSRLCLSGHLTDLSARNKTLTAKLFQQGIGIINLGKLFLGFILDTTNWFLKTLLLQG